MKQEQNTENNVKFCVHLFRNYYNDVDLRNMKDIRKFCKTIRPLFVKKN